MKVGDRETVVYQWEWRECEVCGLPAAWRVTYLFDNARANLASSAYRRDECGWCADTEAFACKKHLNQVHYHPPTGMRWCASFPLKKFKHMGFYKREVKE